MTCGRLTASPEQSWGWNLGIPEPQFHPCSSPALCQNMDKALREAKLSSFSLSLECSLIPWAGLYPAVLQHTEMDRVLEGLEHTGNLQDKNLKPLEAISTYPNK